MSGNIFNEQIISLVKVKLILTGDVLERSTPTPTALPTALPLLLPIPLPHPHTPTPTPTAQHVSVMCSSSRAYVCVRLCVCMA